MRLIDADAFDKVLEGAEIEATRNRKYVFRSALNIIRGNLRNAPTIEERKKGKWIEDAETYYKAVNEKGGGVDENTPYFTEDDIACSECLTMFSVIDNCTEDFVFCPNCGADMRGTP